MGIEVTRDQSVIREGEEVGKVRGVVGLAGTSWGYVDVDDPELRSVNLDHDGLVLQVGVGGEQVAQVDLPVCEGVMDQGDQPTTPSGCSIFSDGGEVFEWLDGVGWSESCFLNEGNQNIMLLEKVLKLLVGILDAVGVELEDVAGGGLRRWRDERLWLGRRWWWKCSVVLWTPRASPSASATTGVVGLRVWQPGARLVYPVRAPTAVEAVGVVGAAVADAARVGGSSGRARVGALATQ